MLVIDATTGQNAITQASLFKSSRHYRHCITKLDGAAKGELYWQLKLS